MAVEKSAPVSGSLGPRRPIWLVLALFGTAFPNYYFLQYWLSAGLDLAGAGQLATSNWISQGVTYDLSTAIVIFWIWAGFELKRKGELHKLWVYIVLAIGLGLSCALPVFLYRHGRD